MRARAPRRSEILAALVAFGLGACGQGGDEVLPPRGQILLYFDTDAPVPAAPGKPQGPDDGAPLFDTLSIEVYEPGQTTPCAGCAREFALDVEKLGSRLVSVGIPARPGAAGYRVRARLFPAAWVTRCPPAGGAPAQVNTAAADFHPRPEATIDVTAALPVVAAEGILERTLLLATDSVGTRRGTLDAPVETTEGRPEPSRVGTWPAAQRTPCKGDPRPDEVCVPGGAYWMGNPRMRHDCGAVSSSSFLVPHLVVLSPFFLQKIEVTVGAFRAGGGNPRYVTPWGGSYTSGKALKDRCTFTPSPGPHEAIALNCVEWPPASDFCQKRGGDLPTEAQFEYVASALGGSFYVWGEDDPKCEDTVFARGWREMGLAPDDILCKPAKQGPGPLPFDSQENPRNLDRLVLPTGTVFDLIGNVHELSADFHGAPDGACWSKAGILTDPLCDLELPGAGHAFRGGAWFRAANPAAARGGLPRGQSAMGVGFRCARPGR